MSDTMNLLVIAYTGHVVAGLTRVAGGPDLEADAMAGRALPVRNIRRETSGLAAFTAWIPSGVLEVKSAPLDARVLASPQDYVIDGGVAIRIAADAPANTVTNLTADRLDLNGAAIAPGEKVLALVGASDDPRGTVRVQAGEYPTPAVATLTLPLTVLPDDVSASVPSGPYGIMVALAGRRLYWATDTVP